MQFKPKTKPANPKVGEIRSARKFAYLPVKCPKTKIIYWLEYITITEAYTYGDFGAYVAYKWKTIKVN